MKQIKSILFKVFLLVSSILLTLFLIILAVNFFIVKSDYISNGNMSFTLDYASFNSDYIFWQEYFCDLGAKCPETVSTVDSLLIHPKTVYGSDYSSDCKRILFLGDSFSTAPFSEYSYGDYFSQKLSEEFNMCIISFHLASGGVGNSQELAKLEDNIEALAPDLVIWQFYWNDLVNNVQLSVHDIDGKQLKRKKAWDNAFFLAGFLNQHISFLRNSTLGTYYFEQSTQKDLLRSWPVDPYTEELYKYNEVFISLLLESGESIVSNNSSKLLTTLSPLECYIVQEDTCPKWKLKTNNELKNILIENSLYINMEATTSSTLDKSVLDGYFSKDDNGNYGARHLSEQGEMYFGTNLFLNSKEIIKDFIID